MHIAIILGPFLPVPPVLGGAVEKVHLALAGAYRAAGHNVTMISREYDGLPREEVIEGVRHIRIRSSERSQHLLVNLALGLGYALRAAAALPQAEVTITNEFFLPLVLPRRKAGRIYVQVGRFPKYQMLLYFRADRLQAVSRAVGAAIVRQTPWLARKVRVIGYAISDTYFRPLPSRRERVILFVGRIAREKGVELLLRAFLLLKQRCDPAVVDGWKLRIIGPHEPSQGGDGAEYLAQLREFARVLGRQCEFGGPIFDQEALVREYQQSAIFAYPSLAEFGEALGVAPLEAMASGCAVIVSDLRCFDDYLENEVTGLTFDHRAEAAENGLAAQLERLVSDAALFAQIASAGHHAACQFRTEPIAARMLADFSALVDDKGHPDRE